MTGRVNARNEATMRIRVFGPGDRTRNIAAVIDTGYSGSLTLSPRLIRELRLPRLGQSDAELGDGRIVSFEFFAGSVLWNRKRVTVEVDEATTGPLVGME